MLCYLDFFGEDKVNRYMLVSAVFFLQSVFTIGQAQSKISAKHKFVRYFDNYLQTKLDQVLPIGLLEKASPKQTLDKLIAGEAYVICSNLCTIDKLYGGYNYRSSELSQRLFNLKGWVGKIPRAEDNFNALKASIYSHIEEIFSSTAPTKSSDLEYSKLNGSVIMIRDDIWYQYPFSFDGYADETITIADTIIKNPATTFSIKEATQPTRSFSANLVLSIGRPQHQYLVASGFYWRSLAEKFGESVVMDWYNDIASPTPKQLAEVVHFLYSNNPTSREFLLEDLYMLIQLSRNWRSSAGLGEPSVDDLDRQLAKGLAKDLAEQRDLILAGDYGTSSSRDLINAALNKAKVSLDDLQPESLSASVFSSGSSLNVSFLTYDLITRHLAGELVVDRSTIEKLFEVLTAHDVSVYYLGEQAKQTVVFERLLHRYQLAKKANYDRSDIDPPIRDVLDRFDTEN